MKDLIKRLLEAGKVDAETAETLNKETEELESKLKSARDESADRRKQIKDLKAEIENLATEKQSMLEALGVDPEEALNVDDLAEKAKGKTQADDQLSAKIKRLEREIEKANAEKSEIENKYKGAKKQDALNKALGKHSWIDKEVVEQLLSGKVDIQDDDFYVGDVSLSDYVDQFASEKPHLLAAKGNAGSGFNSNTAQSNTVNPFARETRNLTEQARILKENPELAQSLKSQAGV